MTARRDVARLLLQLATAPLVALRRHLTTGGQPHTPPPGTSAARLNFEASGTFVPPTMAIDAFPPDDEPCTRDCPTGCADPGCSGTWC